MPKSTGLLSLILFLLIASCTGDHEKDNIGSEVGMMAPEISGLLPSGETFSLKDLRGQLVVIDFWGTWCGPCLREAPELVSLYKDFGDEIQVVTIALEKKDDGRSEEVGKRLGFNWPFRLTEEITFVSFNKTAGSYNVTDIPASFLIDRNGSVLLAHSDVNEIRVYLNEVKGADSSDL